MCKIVPEIVLVYAANCPDLANLVPDTGDLDTNVGAALDSQAFVIGELGRCRVRIVLACLWHQLEQSQPLTVSLNKEARRQGARGTYKVRHEQLQRASLAEEAVRIDREHNGINLELH